jgi:hypothetical protein
MDATLRIIQAAGAQLDIDEIDVGEKVYLAGNTAGISNEAWETIRLNVASIISGPIPSPFATVILVMNLNFNFRKYRYSESNFGKK